MGTLDSIPSLPKDSSSLQQTLSDPKPQQERTGGLQLEIAPMSTGASQESKQTAGKF